MIPHIPDVKDPERWEKCLKISGLFIAAMSVFGFFVGTIAGAADPGGGWAAWRVGLLVAVIFASAAVLISLIGSAMHIGDF